MAVDSPDPMSELAKLIVDVAILFMVVTAVVCIILNIK